MVHAHNQLAQRIWVKVGVVRTLNRAGRRRGKESHSSNFRLQLDVLFMGGKTKVANLSISKEKVGWGHSEMLWEPEEDFKDTTASLGPMLANCGLTNKTTSSQQEKICHIPQVSQKKKRHPVFLCESMAAILGVMISRGFVPRSHPEKALSSGLQSCK